MGTGLKRASHAARCTQPRSVYLTSEQRTVLRACVRIAAEDESVFGGAEFGDPDWMRIDRIITDLQFKLDDDNYR